MRAKRKPKWEPALSVDDALVDQQHKKLIELCEQAADCVDATGALAHERFHTVLNDIYACASEHFRTEETLLASHDYPEFTEHKREHEDFMTHMAEFLYATIEGSMERSALYHYLEAWFNQHKLESDMRYKRYLPGRVV